MTSKAQELEAQLRDLRNGTSDVEAAVVVSSEGLVLASAVPAELDDEKLSAMGGAMQALGERIASELARGDLQQVMVRGDEGYVLLMPIGSSRDVMLTILAQKEAKLGWVMLESRRIASQLSELLAEEVEA